MKKNTQSLIAALVLAGAALSAQAAPIDVSHGVQTIDLTNKTSVKYGASFGTNLATDTFADKIAFSVTTKSSFGADVSSTAAPATVGLNLTGFKLFSSTGTLIYKAPTYVSTGIVDLWTMSKLTLNSGNYYLEVDGIVNSAKAGSYSGNISLKAVPEADTYAMMLAGLGLVGFVARRRKQA
jgi:hypothetical protein